MKRRMYAHMFVPGAMVNSAEHARQARAAREGVDSLAGYQLWRKRNA